jgi:hypothetical protein
MADAYQDYIEHRNQLVKNLLDVGMDEKELNDIIKKIDEAKDETSLKRYVLILIISYIKLMKSKEPGF